MNEAAAPRAGAALAGIVATLILVTSLIALLADPDTFDRYQYQFDLVVTNTLLPLLEVLVAGLVVYAVGKAVVSAWRATPG
jgi:hypothetical protein